MSKDDSAPKGLKENPGVLGDDLGDNAVLTHDVVKARCSRFFTKLLINHSPREISEYFFEMLYKLKDERNPKRLDAFIRDFDEDWDWTTNIKDKKD
jgi:hypothetical protein